MIRLLSGDCRTILPTLPDASVQCVVTSPPYYALRSYLHDDHPDKACEMGSEPTPDAFIAELVAVFREVRRVLRDDGVMFLNLGDSYSSGSRTTQCDPTERILGKVTARPDVADGGARRAPAGIAKPKDLLLMPARVALALQADGWWLRSDIIWAKPNPMPESCRDRPTSAHEHVYLLAKKPRYYYDADAVREELTGNTHFVRSGETPIERAGFHGANRRGSMSEPVTSRNLRNVWTIATAPFPAAHFATFPPELAERCIRAGTSERGCCAACGKPWVRETSSTLYSSTYGDSRRADVPGSNDVKGNEQSGARGFAERMRKETTTTGWSPSCQCNAETRPCVVLDPFSGAGTALLVADRLGRDAIGIDLSHAYVSMAKERLIADCPLFADISPPPAEDPADERMADLFAIAAD